MRTLAAASICVAVSIGAASHAQVTPADTFLQAWALTRDEFFDPAMHGVEWDALGAELLPRAAAAADSAALSAVINDTLARLDASHTRHYHAGEPAFYELLDIFHPDGLDEGEHPTLPAGPVCYNGIGVATEVIEGRVFVTGVYHTGPAERAGLLVGDELVSVEGGPWSGVRAFEGLAGRETTLMVRREADAAPITLTVTPERIRPRDLFLADLHASARVLEHAGRRIAYLRVLNYGHRDYHDAVMEHLQSDLADADALVLDIRGGWGGASGEYLAFRNPLVPEFSMRRRGGQWVTFSAAWRKPLVLLIDRGSRSGKEMLAFALRTHHAATLVGETTAGAVLAGRPFILHDGSLLYLAVGDVRIDGERLEGAGVSPDVEVPRPLPYCEGRDPQLDAAVAQAAEQAAGRADGGG